MISSETKLKINSLAVSTEFPGIVISEVISKGKNI